MPEAEVRYMKIGVSFPTIELQDPEEMKEFAQGAEQLGFHHMTALEHTLGVQTSGNYKPDVHIHEPMVLFAFLSAVTRTIQFANSILILPQRQAVVVARQAAEIDALSGGRMRLGIGLGSNEEEAIGLGSDFHTRGARVEEQLDTIRNASEAAGRPRDAVQVQGRMPLVGGSADEWTSAAERWRELGATHLAVNTSRGGFTTATEHLALAGRFMDEVGKGLAD